MCVVSKGTWTGELASRLESDALAEGDAETNGEHTETSGEMVTDAGDEHAAALDTARRIHERQARHLIEASGANEYRNALDEYEVVVTDERETVEWQVADPGTSR